MKHSNVQISGAGNCPQQPPNRTGWVHLSQMWHLREQAVRVPAAITCLAFCRIMSLLCLLLFCGWWCTPTLEPRNLTVLIPPTAFFWGGGGGGIFLFSASPLWLSPVPVLSRFNLWPSFLLAVQEEAAMSGQGFLLENSKGS